MTAPKLRFKEFVNEICYKELGSLITLMQSGLSRQLKDEDIGLPVLRSNNIQNFRVDYQDIKYWYKNDPQGADTNNYLLKHNDLLVNFINSVAQIGKSTIYNGELGRDTIITTNLMRLQFNNLIIPKFISYYFQTKQYKDYIQSITKPAVNQASFTTKEFQKLKVPYCSIEEQTKIATFLSAVDEKISQLSQKIHLLGQYKQGMMQKLFSQQLRFKADDGSEFEEWKEIKLVHFLKFNPRPINKPEASYHALGVRSHFKGLFNKFDSEPEKISMDTLYRVKENDVVVNITFAWEGAMAVAGSEHDEGLVSHRFPTYLCNVDKVNLDFFKYRFIQKDFLSHLQLCSPGGAGRNRVLNKKTFLEISFDKPCLTEQTKIANFLSAIDQKIDVVSEQLEQAKLWKKGLLQQMFV